MRNWVVLGAIAGLIAIQQFAEFTQTSLFLDSLSNWLHVALFGAITWLLLANYPKLGLLKTSAIVFLIALASEGLQFVTGGMPTVSDLLRDALGFATVVAILRLPIPYRHTVTVMLLAVATLSVPALHVVAAHQKAREFPILYDAQHWHSFLHAQVRAPHAFENHNGKLGLRLTLNDTAWPGLYLKEPVADWHSHDQLVIDLRNREDTPLPISASVRFAGDNRGSSRHVTHQLDPGPHRWRIPLDDLIVDADGNIRHIELLAVYGYGENAGAQVTIGGVHLE